MPIARVRAERRKDAFGAGNAPETRAATRRRRALTRNDPRARLLPHQTRRRACENHVPCPRCTRASGPPWCLTRCQNRKKRGFVRPRNRPGSAPPNRSRRPRPRLEHPSRRLSLRTSENAGRRRRYPRRASRGACFCSAVPTPIRTSPPRAQQRFFVSLVKFFFPPACAVRFRDLSTSKVEGKIGIRRSRPAVDNRVDRDARVDGQTRSDGTPNVRRHSHSAKALRVPKNGMPLARARGSDRGDPQSISGIDASCARPSLEHTAARFRDLVVLASTRARTTGVTRAREPRRFAETRFPRTAGVKRVPGTMASDGGDLKRKVRPRIDHGKTSTPTSRRRDPKLVASSVTPRLPALR